MPTRTARQRFFFLFVFLFSITAPLIVLSTAGFRWSPSTGIIKTGTLLLSTTPRDADVVLDGRRLKDKTPSIVQHVRPGEHTVRFELNGHASWEKRVRVESGMTAFVDTVVLFADAPLMPLLRTPVTTAATQDGTLVWAKQTSEWTEIWSAGVKAPTPHLVYRTADDGDARLHMIDDRRVRIVHGDKMRTIDTSGALAPRTPDSRLTLTSTPRATVVEHRDRSGEPFVLLPQGAFEVTSVRGSLALVEDAAAMRLALIDQSDTQAPLRLMEDAFKTQWIDDRTLLFADRYAVHIYRADTHETETLLRVSEPIVEAFWHEAIPSYVFYATAREVRAVDMWARDGRLSHTLATADRVFGFGLDARGQTLIVAAQRGEETGWFTQTLYGSSPENEATQRAEIELKEGIDENIQQE